MSIVSPTNTAMRRPLSALVRLTRLLVRSQPDKRPLVPGNRQFSSSMPGGRSPDTCHPVPSVLSVDSSEQLCSISKEYGCPTTPSGSDSVRILSTLQQAGSHTA